MFYSPSQCGMCKNKLLPKPQYSCKQNHGFCKGCHNALDRRYGKKIDNHCPICETYHMYENYLKKIQENNTNETDDTESEIEENEKIYDSQRSKSKKSKKKKSKKIKEHPKQNNKKKSYRSDDTPRKSKRSTHQDSDDEKSKYANFPTQKLYVDYQLPPYNWTDTRPQQVSPIPEIECEKLFYQQPYYTPENFSLNIQNQTNFPSNVQNQNIFLPNVQNQNNNKTNKKPEIEVPKPAVQHIYLEAKKQETDSNSSQIDQSDWDHSEKNCSNEFDEVLSGTSQTTNKSVASQKDEETNLNEYMNQYHKQQPNDNKHKVQTVFKPNCKPEDLKPKIDDNWGPKIVIYTPPPNLNMDNNWTHYKFVVSVEVIGPSGTTVHQTIYPEPCDGQNNKNLNPKSFETPVQINRFTSQEDSKINEFVKNETTTNSNENTSSDHEIEIRKRKKLTKKRYMISKPHQDLNTSTDKIKLKREKQIFNGGYKPDFSVIPETKKNMHHELTTESENKEKKEVLRKSRKINKHLKQQNKISERNYIRKNSRVETRNRYLDIDEEDTRNGLPVVNEKIDKFYNQLTHMEARSTRDHPQSDSNRHQDVQRS